MTTMEKIRAEIQKVLDVEGDSENARAQALALMWVLEIIDKYASEECDNDCEHCAYLECPIDDYQTDMDEAWEQVKPGSMTREEAINKLINARYADEFQGNEELTMAHLMAIQALEQEPCDDAVSRQAVLDVIEFEDKWILDANGHNKDTEIAFSGLKTRITNLPSVQPKAKTGRWITHEESITLLTGETVTGGVVCSECGYKTHNKAHVIIGCPYKFCQNCGADMRGADTESEDKE